jgi:hypothetical protein
VDTLAACRRPSVSCASRGGVSPARAARGPFRLAHRRPFLLRDMLHSCGRKCMRSSRVLGHVRVGPAPFPAMTSDSASPSRTCGSGWPWPTPHSIERMLERHNTAASFVPCLHPPHLRRRTRRFAGMCLRAWRGLYTLAACLCVSECVLGLHAHIDIHDSRVNTVLYRLCGDKGTALRSLFAGLCESSEYTVV